MLNNFYQGDAWGFTGEILLDGVAPNITTDRVSFMIKSKKSDLDDNALIDIDADVTAEGATGIYMFLGASLITTDLTKIIAPGTYYYEVNWHWPIGGNKVVLESGTVKVLERVADV